MTTITQITLKATLTGPGMDNIGHDDLLAWINSCLNCNTNHISVSMDSCRVVRGLKSTPVQIRRDRETKLPVLFFRNSNTRGQRWLECFDMQDGHSEVDDAYRLRCEKLDARKLPDDALRLLGAWNSLPGEYGVPVQRLPRI